MCKNQLQELAQRSCFNLPSYSCIREGPDHSPRFKATVNFNGDTFESPTFFSTLRQAEHASAEVALNTLANRGPSRALAARVLCLNKPPLHLLRRHRLLLQWNLNAMKNRSKLSLLAFLHLCNHQSQSTSCKMRAGPNPTNSKLISYAMPKLDFS
ncbi:hypothetical protein QYF36_003764 [Acer negundo]|nr:hypothetical protein QYF36_003764 [Acer negundo]